MKKCHKCFKLKEYHSFHKDSSKSDGFYGFCKLCRKLHPSRTKDPFKIKAQKLKQKQWLAGNPEWKLQYKRKYYAKNKDKILDYEKNRIRSNINVRLSNQLRKRTGQAIRNKSKKGSAVRDLGCSVSEFIVYLESKFVEGMSWDNYGHKGWHIDHIIPLSKFNLEDEFDFKKASHYTNLQPLWAIDNLKKGSSAPSDV